MKRISALLAAAVACACATVPSDDRLVGLWDLRIRNLDHRQITAATIRFTDDQARSCIVGNWKRVIVESIGATDNKFFPLSDALSYTVEGPDLIIGRNEVCDGYLRLRGKLERGKVHGAYYTLGLSGGNDLGDFSLERMP